MLHKPTCYTSSSIGPCPTLCDNFLQRDVTTSITWDDGWNFAEDNSFLKVYHQCEPPAVLNVIDTIIRNHKFYDLILAFDERVLSECKNAKFLTESSCSWIDRRSGSASPSPIWNGPTVINYNLCDVAKKRYEASFLTSSKGWLPGHKFRQEIYDKLPNMVGSLAISKHRSPPRIDDKRTVLEPVQFSIVAENCQHNNYYTEKIVDCFIAKTFPVYWGCPNLREHFNPEGFLMFENYEHLMHRLETLGPALYIERLEAIEDNFQRALKNVHTWDLMENYITEGIQNKLKGTSMHVAEVVPKEETGRSLRSFERKFRR